MLREDGQRIRAERDAIAVRVSRVAREFGASFDRRSRRLQTRLEARPLVRGNSYCDQEWTRPDTDYHSGGFRGRFEHQ